MCRELIKVQLREVQVGPRYLSWLQDPQVTHYLEGNPNGYTLESLDAYVHAREKDSWFFGIYANDEYVGNIKAGPLNWRHKHADIGIMIGERSVWGKGVGTQAIELLADYCFTNGMHVLTAGIIEGNLGSVKAFIKAGFTYAGDFPEYRWLEGWKAEMFYVKVVGRS